MKKLKAANLIVVLAVHLLQLWNELGQMTWPGGLC